jgi:hypothetical protein
MNANRREIGKEVMRQEVRGNSWAGTGASGRRAFIS